MNTYGCHNTPRLKWIHVRDTRHYIISFMYPEEKWEVITDTSTTECQYRKTTPDPKCEGCTK